MTLLFPFSTIETEISYIFVANKKHHRYEAYKRTLTNHRIYPCHSRTPVFDNVVLNLTKSFIKPNMNMKEVIISWKAKESLNDLQSMQAKAENALEEIRGLVDIPCTDINTLTKPFLRSFVGQKISEVSRTTFLTSDTKSSLIAEWQKKEKVATKAIQVIQDFVEACLPEGVVSIQDGELITDISLNEIADKKNLLDVPEKASEHYSKIIAIRDAIAALREFETSEDTKPMNLNTILNIGEDEVASAWATGWIKRDHLYDTLLNRTKHQRNFITGININE